MELDSELFFKVFHLAGRWAAIDTLMTIAAEYAILLLLLMVLLPMVRPKTTGKVRTGLYAGIAAVSAFLVAQAIQVIIPRPRPFVVYGFVPLVDHAPDAAFPSDYATVALSWVGVWIIATRSRWLSLWAGVVTSLLLVSRVFVGLHFPTDMVGGAVIGVLFAVAVWRSRNVVDALLKLASRLSEPFG